MGIKEKYKEWAYTWGRCIKCGKWTSYKLDISDNRILYFPDDLITSVGIHAVRKLKDIESLSICPDCMRKIVIPSLSDNKGNRRKKDKKERNEG